MSESNQQTACKQCGKKIDVNALACPGCGEPRSPRPDRRFEGVEISGKYLVKSRIARGGMGEVYRAEHKEMRQSVAVKFLHRRFAEDEGFAQRFLNEARYAGRVSHPNAVRLFDFGKLDDGTLYMIMEFVRGRCLTDIVDELQMLPINMAVRVAAQVAEVLASAHELRIIHRDVKPDNIMLVRTPGGRFSVKVLDFGIAKVLDESDSMQTETGVMFGTPEYMSPEQASGKKVDQRSDVYSLGLVLYFMLAGSPPFHGKNKLRIIHQQAREEPDPVEMRARQPLPPALIELIGQMLQKDPEARPQRMLEVFRRLEELELRDTSSFEEARSQSAMYKIGAGDAAQEALPTSRTDRGRGAPQGRAPHEKPRSSTMGFAPLDEQVTEHEKSSVARRGADESSRGRRHDRGQTTNPHRPRLTASASGAHIDPGGLRPLGGGHVSGVSAANTMRRQLGSRGPLRDFAPSMPLHPDEGPFEPQKKPTGRLALLVALSITFACIGGAAWLGLNYYEAGGSSPLRTLSSPESLRTAVASADEQALDPAEEAGDSDADSTAEAVREEARVQPSRPSPTRAEPEAPRAPAADPPPERHAAAEPAQEDSFDDDIGRARTLIASARVAEARDQLRSIEPSNDEQVATLGEVRDRLTEIERLHTRLGEALENQACGDAERIASELSSVGGTHHLSRWRGEIRTCEQPSQSASDRPSAQPGEGGAGSTASPAQGGESAAESPPAAQELTREGADTPPVEAPNGQGEAADAPGALPEDFEAPAEQPASQPEQNPPSAEPERTPEDSPAAEPEPTRPRAPAPVLPPSEL